MTLTLSDPQKNYEEYKVRFANMSDEQLKDTFNDNLGKPGWVGSRAMFSAALCDEFEKRGLIIKK